jgi:hypothetical protein
MIVLVVTLATAVVAAAGTAEMSEQRRRRQVRNLLKRLNKEPLASIQVLFIVLWCCRSAAS